MPRLYALYKQHKGDQPFIESKEYYHFLYGESDLDKMAHHEKLRSQYSDSLTGYPGYYLKHDTPLFFIQGPESRNIKAIGPWDTVGALGVPDIGNISLKWLRGSPGFHNVRVSPCKLGQAIHAATNTDSSQGWSTPSMRLPWMNIEQHSGQHCGTSRKSNHLLSGR